VERWTRIPCNILPGIARIRHAVEGESSAPKERPLSREPEALALIVFKRQTRYKVSGA
jgi:hypothetical protein